MKVKQGKLEEKIFEEAVNIATKVLVIYTIYELVVKNQEPSLIQIVLIIIDFVIAIPVAVTFSRVFNKHFIEKNINLYLAIIFLIVYFAIRNLLFPNIDIVDLFIEEFLIFIVEYFIITFFSQITKNINNIKIAKTILFLSELLAIYIFEVISESIDGKDNNFIEI